MPICPICKQPQKRRVKGACPGCGSRINIYNGVWFSAELGSPTTALLKYFENRVSAVLSRGRSVPAIYVIPRKSGRYSRELIAAQQLLDQAGGNYDLAIAAINILFEHPRFSWKYRDSLLYLMREYLVALAIARSNQVIEMEKDAQAKQALVQALTREDIFS